MDKTYWGNHSLDMKKAEIEQLVLLESHLWIILPTPAEFTFLGEEYWPFASFFNGLPGNQSKKAHELWFWCHCSVLLVTLSGRYFSLFILPKGWLCWASLQCNPLQEPNSAMAYGWGLQISVSRFHRYIFRVCFGTRCKHMPTSELTVNHSECMSNKNTWLKN